MSVFNFLQNPGGVSSVYVVSHLVKAAVEESVDLRLVEGQFLHLSPVIQTEVHQVLCSSCG